ncbi:alpha-amylase family protein [Snuella sedimenti]|uniref:Enterotoxin n=1 Tax=Snuella sedimenti TaxID=2798802 RepID=A0A8J7LND0_9FLAO|nr:hypothetical protein [Snuella sedimenti]MBJ6368634.1 hypothetical protein [Snuella sedimenti]
MGAKKKYSIIRIIGMVSVLLLFTCKKETNPASAVLETNSPGIVHSEIDGDKIILKNKAIEAVWSKANSTIELEKVANNYDGTEVNLKNITLFNIELENGENFSNKDFKLQEPLSLITLKPTDSLPNKALSFSGKEISGNLISRDDNIAIQWAAQLREGANYIKQNIKIEAIHTAVKIKKITFFDGTLQGAWYDGSVLGSPIIYKNFYFGMEHPIAQSKALLVRTIGDVGVPQVDISNIIDGAGAYVVSYEHAGGPDQFNINSIALLENGEIVTEDKHILNGIGGSSLYKLELQSYTKDAKYEMKASIDQPENASGTFHIYKKIPNILNFYVNREDELKPSENISEWAVIGIFPENQKRRFFSDYIKKERARPYKQFLHYNCWWDITDDGASSFTSEQLTERMHAWNEKFIKPFNIKLDAFVFDDGWDDLDNVWYFDPIKFPNGFESQAKLCKEYNSGIGVWMSPFGGYLENKDRRVASAKREGLETNDKGLSLAGKNYYNRFLERATDMLANYKVNYFKFDGFGGSEPKYLPDMEAGVKLISNLRKTNPDVYVNITVGTWPSPFWLKYADCIWRGAGDLHQAGVGSTTQKMMTYRDGTLHNNIVNRAPLYPLNSIMTVGIAYANLGHPSRYVNDNLDDFKDMVYSSFAAGSSLQELYISYNKMKPEFWAVVAEGAKWAKANETILEDTHWIGGSPINLETYGFASWTQEKGIISLRNPSDKKVKFTLNLAEVFELPKEAHSNFEFKSLWNEDKEKESIIINTNETKEIELEPFEVRILEGYLME